MKDIYYQYLNILNIKEIPLFLIKYLESPSLLRLRNVGYFCGMDYASKNIYDFGEYISRFDHSLDVALITWKYTNNKEATLAGLFHDIATPCFSHVVDYMNKDYATQESTEELTEEVIKRDEYLISCLKEDNINVEDVINFKKYTIVDNNRPKVCADRIDGVLLTGMFWTKDLSIEEVSEILNHLIVFNNEENELELGFNDKSVANRVVEVSNNIDVYCHSNEDNYMMELLANLTKYAIDNGYLKYEELFSFDEDKIHEIFNSINNEQFKSLYASFKCIKADEVPFQEMPYIKKRDLRPLVDGKRPKYV